MARLLLGVSGGIAAYKALEFTRLAVKAGHGVRVIQSEAAQKFIGRSSFDAITGAPVLSSEFELDPARGAYPGETIPDRAPINHLALVQRAHLYLIAPATADTIAKLAGGHADNLLSTAALAAQCPVAVAPAMNNWMYLHPATQANLDLLSARGVTVIDPGEGDLASHGEHGIGRLAEPAELLEICEALLTTPSLKGLRVLVSAGGTREPIDSVRYIGNRSSGRMGLALAAQASRRGARVRVIAANVDLPMPPGVELISVQTAAEMALTCQHEFESCDVLLMAAAVADFRPASAAVAKLKKDRGVPELEFESTEDVLSALSRRRRPGQVLVGFAAEHGPGALTYGADKLTRKRLDAIVVNDISRPGIGFEATENAVTILTADGVTRDVPQMSKERVAVAVLDEVERLLGQRREAADGAARANAGSTARV